MRIDHNIYDLIWQADSNRFSVSLRNRQGEWVNPNADILLDHQTKSANQRWLDLAPHPLFHKVNKTRLREPIYSALINLFDNYIADHQLLENYSQQETEEIEHFISLILSTQPINLAYIYISQNLKYAMTLNEFKEQLRLIWFEPFTNYFSGEVLSFCSGFEHIFVGEAKLNSDKTKGEIIGYHNWVKFYLDESQERVNYLGTNYKIPTVSQLLSPHIIALKMTGKLKNEKANSTTKLYKEKGSFFVGSSPECEIALATVVYFDSLQKNKFQYVCSTLINTERYDLIINREITKDNKLGQHIRSFYPQFRGKVIILHTTNLQLSKQHGPIVITSALIEPKDNPLHEWVELKNISSHSISLDGWYLSDQLSRFYSLRGILESNEPRKFFVRTTHFHSMKLSDSGGLIALYQANGKLISLVSYKKVKSGEITIFWQE